MSHLWKFKILILIGILYFMAACGAGMPVKMGNSSSSSNSSSSVNLSDPAAVQNQALMILANNCTSCHTATSGPLGVFNLLDVNHLITSGLVVAGNPNGSTLLQSIEANRMPPTAPLSNADKIVLRTWIQGGAQAPSTPIATPTPIPLGPTYTSLAANVLTPKCVGCHSTNNKTAGYAFDTFANVSKSVKARNAAGSLLYTITQSGSMPPRPNPTLTSDEQRALSDWIQAGALNN